MKERKKWELINSCSTADELAQAIIDIAEDGAIVGTSTWDAHEQATDARMIIESNWSYNVPYNRLTRAYGIRQQAMHIRHYC